MVSAVLAALALILAPVFLYHYFQHPIEPASLPYEEMHASPSALHSEIGDIESAIYECLYQDRIPEGNIFFSAVEPRLERGNRWDFTEITIELPEKDSLHHLKERIIRALDKLKPTVTYREEDISSTAILCHVFTQDFYTHRLVLKSSRGVTEAPRKLPRIALIVDDLGYDLEMVQRLLQANIPLTLSVLPMAPRTDAVVEAVRRHEADMMLHLPMEPENFPALNPGPGALMADMSGAEIRQVIASHLKRVAGARGVNNHMGSRFTRDRDKMRVVLVELKKRKMFYIDSRTTKETVAFSLAREMGIPAANRNVFLDNDLSPKAMRFQMERLLSTARRSGAAIGIGHPNEKTLELLKAYGRRLTREFQVVRAADLTG